MLEQIDRDLWVAQQPLKFLGLEVGTRMTVVRLADDALILISPIAMDSELQHQLNALGQVAFLVAPNLFHYLYLEAAKNLYPHAKIIAPPGLSEKQPSLTIDIVLSKDSLDFYGELEHHLLSGFQSFVPPKITAVNETVFYHLPSQTLIITDLAYNFDRSFPLITQLATRVLGSYGALKPSWLEKIAVEDKQLLKRSLERILQWDFQRIIMAHGRILDANAKQQLAAGYQWLQ